MGQFVMRTLMVTCGLTMLGVLGLPHAAWAKSSATLPPLAVTTFVEDLTSPAALDSESDLSDLAVDAMGIDGRPNQPQGTAEDNTWAPLSLDSQILDRSVTPWAAPDEATAPRTAALTLEPLFLLTI